MLDLKDYVIILLMISIFILATLIQYKTQTQTLDKQERCKIYIVPRSGVYIKPSIKIKY